LTTFTNIFGGNLIGPSIPTYNPITLTGNLTLSWPLETAPNSNLCTSIIDITVGSTGAYVTTLPPANQVGNGTAFIINNFSSYTQTINGNTGVTIATIAPGSTFFFYLQNNSTVAGTWFAFQYGTAVSTPSVASIAGPGLRAVGTTLGQDIVVTTLNTNFTIGNNNQTQLLNWSGGTGAFLLPLAGTVGANWYIQLRNSGTGILTITNSGSDTINGTANLAMNPGDSCFLATDGTNWYTIGLGPVITGNFNFVTISLAGLGGTYTLSGTQLNQIGYRFTGALTSNIVVVVPNTKQEYWVNNQCTGFTLSIGTSGQVSPPTVNSAASAIYYCDGANVYLATPSSAISSIPVTVAQGGTGSTTAGGALVNLGGTSVGIAVFTAFNNAGAQAAMAAPSVADAYIFGMIN